ncbi:hypothetical protein FHR81_001408 [Actinoalloteichus hoggarensis]|uniref:Uncharacterized protein n=1 Tax=Actinoalloteichus hoggarensis TaxID=1470176 RepID=A0A221W049_9PSEU|nr:hypothetical protein [Actinoalloteichus hoggarensis]ASO19142.1 hypothetical protein AHOG_07475 [Actinoalloteichus hoggarensis]MBB5920378.1 hypothetical protein [Actinoalloteichus hoggarensis]
MALPDRPVHHWLVPLLAVPATVLGVVLLYYGQSALVPAMADGVENVCGAPDCALGIGVMLFVAGVASVLVAVLLAVLLGRSRARGGRTIGLRLALRDAGAVAACVLSGYVIVSVVLWWMIG